MSESTVTFRHEYSESFKLKGVKHLIKQNIIDGAKGLSFMFLKKVGDDEFYKVYAMETDGKYKVEETKGEKKTESELSEADVKKMLKSNKDFDFVLNYMDNDRGKYKGKVMRGGAMPDVDLEIPMMSMEQDGGAKKRRSRKTSKKASKRKVMKGGALYDENPMMPMEQDGGAKKRRSKKASRKVSKKGSKKMTGGGKKRSKKASKKVSKKASKKRSKKGSKKMTGGGKKRSKKASKKASKKGSKKASKKASRKSRK
jgi:hypothetical protein